MGHYFLDTQYELNRIIGQDVSFDTKPEDVEKPRSTQENTL